MIANRGQKWQGEVASNLVEEVAIFLLFPVIDEVAKIGGKGDIWFVIHLFQESFKSGVTVLIVAEHRKGKVIQVRC